MVLPTSPLYGSSPHFEYPKQGKHTPHPHHTTRDQTERDGPRRPLCVPFIAMPPSLCLLLPLPLAPSASCSLCLLLPLSSSVYVLSSSSASASASPSPSPSCCCVCACLGAAERGLAVGDGGRALSVRYVCVRARSVWSPAGGWWANPRHWKRNTACGFGFIGVALMFTFSVSAANEVRARACVVMRVCARARAYVRADAARRETLSWYGPGPIG